jgi:hypothetical protein
VLLTRLALVLLAHSAAAARFAVALAAVARSRRVARSTEYGNTSAVFACPSLNVWLPFAAQDGEETKADKDKHWLEYPILIEYMEVMIRSRSVRILCVFTIRDSTNWTDVSLYRCRQARRMLFPWMEMQRLLKFPHLVTERAIK